MYSIFTSTAACGLAIAALEELEAKVFAAYWQLDTSLR